MGRKKSVPQVPVMSEDERKLEELGRQAAYMRDRAAEASGVCEELTYANIKEFAPAIAYLRGMARALYQSASAIDDTRTGGDMPF